MHWKSLRVLLTRVTLWVLAAALMAPLPASANASAESTTLPITPLDLTATPEPPPTTPPVPEPEPEPAPAPDPIVEPQLPPLPSGMLVRIGLGRSEVVAEVSAPRGMYLVAEGEVHWQTPPGEVITLKLAGDRIQVVGLAQHFASPVRLSPLPSDNPNYISYNGRPYRGDFEVLIAPKDGRLSVVNQLNVDDYIKGVVPREMPYTWPLDALMAQAVAARTYALSKVGEYVSEGFDLVGTVSSQVYGGVLSEMARSTAAVVATARQVLTFEGRLAVTYFFSSSGGHTENNESIWGPVPVPYLRGVPDYDDLIGNMGFSWRYTYTLTRFADLMSAANYPIGTPSEVVHGPKVGPSGRPTQWTVRGNGGSHVLSAEGIRWALKIPSSPRTLTIVPSGPINPLREVNAAHTVSVVGQDGAVIQRKVEGVAILGESKTTLSAKPNLTLMGQVTMQDARVEVIGGGYGHSVGMSQWGAHGLALLGRTHQQILTHYYRGTKVENRS